MRYPLTTPLSKYFMYVGYYALVFVTGCIIYSVVNRLYDAVVVCLIFLTVLYLAFLKNSWKFKSVAFDEEFIYYDQSKISYSEVMEIKEGRIKFNQDGKVVTLYYNKIYAANFSQLKSYYINYPDLVKN